MFLSERLSTESLHTYGATTKDSSLYIPAAASTRDAMWLRFRADTVFKNGVSCAASGHASNKVTPVLIIRYYCIKTKIVNVIGVLNKKTNQRSLLKISCSSLRSSLLLHNACHKGLNENSVSITI